ncbi:ankyrin repeat domain-containing protein [Streptomyces sp. NPDC006512]|uniref:ankyrin repeat domain-containing protein n=1 Tax=Streptomyces sp. NPDC006512 TaxID=3154307 RepID=UPI0033A4F634
MNEESWYLKGWDWNDLTSVRERLADGASPIAHWGSFGQTPLHLAAAAGAAESVAAMLAYTREVDVPDDRGRTPLWWAVEHVRGETVRVLLANGADAWRPCVGEWTPGRLALTTSLASLVEGTPEAVPLTAAQRTKQAWADQLISVFAAEEIHTNGLRVAFTDVFDEDEVIHRLGADPAECPVFQQDSGIDQMDLFDVGGNHAVGVTGTALGCIISQPFWDAVDDDELARRLSPATVYSLYFNPKGGTSGTLYRNGIAIRHEEIGPWTPFADDPAEHWLYRFWQQPCVPFPHGDANLLAYACAMGGITKASTRDCWALSRGPRRVVRVPLVPISDPIMT